MYAIKNEEEDKMFIEKSSIIKKMKPSDIMNYLGIYINLIKCFSWLGINKKFIICEHLNFTARTSLIVMDQSKYTTDNRDSIDSFKH